MPTRCRHASVQKANPLFRRPQEVTRDMDKKQGPWSRREMIERLERQDEFDVAVIGAGATGLGVALDAASRGMSVLIVDGQDWASGHASRSSKHIGSDIRRLVCPARWDRVREELYERRLLLQNAPSLVRAQNYVIPCRSKIGMTMRASSLALYSLFSSGGRGTRPVSMQGRVNALGMLPGIERKGLAGAVTFTDAVCDDAGLALALLSGAVEYGAVALNRMRMIDAEADGDVSLRLCYKMRKTAASARCVSALSLTAPVSGPMMSDGWWTSLAAISLRSCAALTLWLIRRLCPRAMRFICRAAAADAVLLRLFRGRGVF